VKDDPKRAVAPGNGKWDTGSRADRAGSGRPATRPAGAASEARVRHCPVSAIAVPDPVP